MDLRGLVYRLLGLFCQAAYSFLAHGSRNSDLLSLPKLCSLFVPLRKTTVFCLGLFPCDDIQKVPLGRKLEQS